jgi:hypothetical protein
MGTSRAKYLGGGLVAAVLLAGLATHVFGVIAGVRQDNVDVRMEGLQFAMLSFFDHPLVGVGPLDERFVGLSTVGLPGVDNTFAIELAATGFLAFIPIVLIWIFAFCSAGRAYLKTSEIEMRVLAGVLFSCVVLQFLSVQAYVGIGEKAPWLMMGLALSLAGLSRAAQSTSGAEAVELA